MKSNQTPFLHPMTSDNAGENYWFNGFARYVMECVAIRDGSAKRIEIPTIEVGTWPLPEGTYDPAFDAVGIPTGSQLFGLFTTNYQGLGDPDALVGLSHVDGLNDLADGKYCIFTAGAFRYVVIMSDAPVTVTVPGYECGPLASYDLFAGLTGDNFTQLWSYEKPYGCSVSELLVGKEYVEGIFDEIGYSSEYVSEEQLIEKREFFVEKLLDSIDSGIPVIVALGESRKNEPAGLRGYQRVHDAVDCTGYHCAIVGYDDDGDTLLTMRHQQTVPTRVATDDLFKPGSRHGLIFVGERTRNVDVTQVHRDALLRLPKLMTTKTDKYVFGAEAFREWANYIETHTYTDEELSGEGCWWRYTNYVCVLATNSGNCQKFLNIALELNPDLTFIPELKALYKKQGSMWGGGESPDSDSLEAIGGGFNVTAETLNDPSMRTRIVAKLREFADLTDEIVSVLNNYIKTI